MVCSKCNTELPDGAAYCFACGKKQVFHTNGRCRPNGTGSVYKRGKTWEAAVVLEYQVKDGKALPVRRTKGGFKTKKAAMEYLPLLKAQEKVKTIPTLRDLWVQWQEGPYKKLSESQKESYRIAWKKMESIGNIKIDQLTVSDLQHIINEKAPTFYPARDIKSLASKLFQRAMADQFVSVNLSKFLTLPELVEKEQDAFSKEEIRALWNDYAAGNRWTGYILLMAYSGMMPGELLQARKDQIDFEGKQICGAGLKTKTRKKSAIVLADVILPVLQDLCDYTDGEKLIRIGKDNFYKVFYATLERAGCRRLTPYACRHTAASALAAENIPPSVIQKIMRHAKFSSTQRYIHVDIDPMLEAINKLADRGQ